MDRIEKEKLCRAAYRAVQWTWGLPQTLLGLVLYTMHRREQRFGFHGAAATAWDLPGSVSLGMFVFVSAVPPYAARYAGEIGREELFRRLLVHEYGHTVQSLLLGPLYLPVIGLPSLLWSRVPALCRRRARERRSYFEFYTERWANRLGERATGERSIGRLLVD